MLPLGWHQLKRQPLALPRRRRSAPCFQGIPCSERWIKPRTTWAATDRKQLRLLLVRVARDEHGGTHVHGHRLVHKAWPQKGGDQRRPRILSVLHVHEYTRLTVRCYTRLTGRQQQVPVASRPARHMPCPTVPLDLSRLQKFATEGVPRGDADAQVRLGHMHYMGADGPKNHVEARRLYRLSAEQGNAEAQATLGQMNYRGEGEPINYEQARRWCGLAAAQDHAVAATLLGIMHYNGVGGPQDFLEARRVLGLATAKGLAEAFAWLGTMHYRGDGGPVDFAEARVLLTQASEQVGYLPTACALHMHRMRTAWAPHVHRVCPACALRVRCVCAACAP